VNACQHVNISLVSPQYGGEDTPIPQLCHTILVSTSWVLGPGYALSVWSDNPTTANFFFDKSFNKEGEEEKQLSMYSLCNMFLLS
jgi:hypothetical protein